MKHMRDIAHPELVAEIRAWCAARGVALTAFGMAALNDPSFFADLEEGRECRRATLVKVREYMATHSEVTS
jgi:hypothetical protein